jgi:hypothetical protein
VSSKMNAVEVNRGHGNNSSKKSIKEQSAEIPEPQERPENAAIGGPIEAQTYQEEQIQKAIQRFAMYLNSEREIYYDIAKPLSDHAKHSLQAYFGAALLDQVRVLQLTDRRVDNPWFYPQARAAGIRHLPDITHKAAVTFLDVVVFNEKITSRDLFHGLVHAAQVKTLGVPEFTDLFVRGFLQARSYFLVPLKAHAFALDARYASNPDDHFSVEDEIRDWWRLGHYS